MEKGQALLIFGYKSYRKFINTWIEIQDQPRGQMRKLAQAARCETSHISRVLSGQLALTLDQAFRLVRILNLNEVEKKYFLKLVELERSGDAEFRSEIDAELNAMTEAQQNFSNRYQDTAVTSDGKEVLYYSSWHWSAIHIILSIPKYQNPQLIAQRIGLDETQVRSSLDVLEDFGLVKKENGKWVVTNQHIHLAKNSPMNSVQHSNWRHRAVLKTQDPRESGLHYTIVQSISLEDYDRLRQLFLKTLDEYRAIANPSKEEELTCLTIDFFKV